MRMYECRDDRVAEVYGRDVSTSTSAMGISRFHFHAVSSRKKETQNVHGYTSGKSTDMLRKNPGSARVRYALKIPRMPASKNDAYSASCLKGVYETSTTRRSNSLLEFNTDR